MMSPAAMYSLAWRTMAANSAFDILASTGPAAPQPGSREAGRAGEAVGQLVEALQRLVVGAVRIVARTGQGHQLLGSRQVVEHHESVNEHELNVGQSDVVGAGVWQALEALDRLVPQIADGPTLESGQLRAASPR